MCTNDILNVTISLLSFNQVLVVIVNETHLKNVLVAITVFCFVAENLEASWYFSFKSFKSSVSVL